jgi:hypothetical protein
MPRRVQDLYRLPGHDEVRAISERLVTHNTGALRVRRVGVDRGARFAAHLLEGPDVIVVAVGQEDGGNRLRGGGQDLLRLCSGVH